MNTGASVFDEASIRDRAPGTGDVLQLLKLNPAVQFTTEEGHATRDTLRDLLPSEISISGGRLVIGSTGINTRQDNQAPSPRWADAASGRRTGSCPL